MITDTNNPIIPALAFDGENYLLAWHAGLTNSQIFSQFFNRSAVAIGPEFTLFSPQGTNEPLYGSVLFDGNRFLVTAIVGGIGSSGFTGSSSTWGNLHSQEHRRADIDRYWFTGRNAVSTATHRHAGHQLYGSSNDKPGFAQLDGVSDKFACHRDVYFHRYSCDQQKPLLSGGETIR
jgi:hypothetical protein